MSHVVSSQPSATSPYQPTATEDIGNEKVYTPTTTTLGKDNETTQDDYCINTRNKRGFCLSVCAVFSIFCESIKTCTGKGCECCADCLTGCCEDKPKKDGKRYKNRRYRKSKDNDSCCDNTSELRSNSLYQDTTEDGDLGVSLSAQYVHVGVGKNNCEPGDNSKTPKGSGHGSETHHASGHDLGTHNGSTHNSSQHDSATHPLTGHDSGMNDNSEHDSNTCQRDNGGADNAGGSVDGGAGD